MGFSVWPSNWVVSIHLWLDLSGWRIFSQLLLFLHPTLLHRFTNWKFTLWNLYIDSDLFNSAVSFPHIERGVLILLFNSKVVWYTQIYDFNLLVQKWWDHISTILKNWINKNICLYSPLASWSDRPLKVWLEGTGKL